MKFVDEQVQPLDPHDPAGLVELFTLLCGEKIAFSEYTLLCRVLRGLKRISYEQFNEILLILNQKRISRRFFEFFFAGAKGRSVSLNAIPNAVERFRGFAMLRYGNFRFAYRQLSQAPTREFGCEIQDCCAMAPADIRKKYASRPRKAIGIRPISREKTWHVGYLSRGKVSRDTITIFAILLRLGQTTIRLIRWWWENEEWLRTCQEHGVKSASGLKDIIGDLEFKKQAYRISADTARAIQQIRFQSRLTGLQETKWRGRVYAIFRELQGYRQEILGIQKRARENTAVYLTWDYMDVYVATSMREKWEYESVFDFLQAVFQKPSKLRGLNIRYFDPTQSYSTNRIDKGLVEALMLKRADCTLYLAQETDTLGKDSELASTLAQGKPVIAYVPEIKNARAFARKLRLGPLVHLWKRWLLLEAEDVFNDARFREELARAVDREQRAAIGRYGLTRWRDKVFLPLRRAMDQRTFNLIRREEEELRARLGRKLHQICLTLAVAEKTHLNRRAEYLSRVHPLAIQVRLSSGVANGVLVVRNAPACRKLIHCLLTRNLSFRIVYEKGITELRETISECPYRVVTDDAKLTNSFWNFYLQEDIAQD
jgi:hypothetical protein